MTIWVFVMLLLGLGAAVLITTWYTRGISRRAEANLHRRDESSSGSTPQTHDIMTTSAGTRLLLRGGRLVLPNGNEIARRPRDGAEP
jgi:hypothetical protein